MRRLGKVLHISKRGALIVRVDKTPPIGAKVVDKNVRQIGRILDVFGPVKKPYVSIKPDRGIEAADQIGQIIYLYKR